MSLLDVVVRDGLKLLLLLSLVSIAGPSPGMAVASPPAEVPLDQWVVRRWSVDDGLPSTSLNRVLAAADGYIWATSFTGLVRFDGQGFTVFGQRDVNALATSGFVGISSGRDGRLWVGTQGDGPWWFDGHTLRPSHPELALEGEVVSLLEDRKGVVWVGLQEPALLRVEGSDYRRVEDPALQDVLIREIEQGRDGRLWIATRGKGLVACEDRRPAVSCRSFTRAEGLPSDQVNAVAEGPSGVIWVATLGGLGRIDAGGGSAIEELSGIRVSDLTFGPKGHLWMTTSRGVMRWHPQRREPELLGTGAGLPLRGMTSMSFDHEGSLWLSSRNHGLFQLTSGRFSNFTTRDGLASERIHSAFDPGGGEIWVGTEAGRIQRIVRGRVGEVPLETDLGAAQLMDFYEDREGRRWISTYAGLLRKEGPDERLFGIADGLPSLEVRWARQDRKGELWVGSRGGVVRLGEGDRFVSEPPWGPALDGISFSFDETPDGRLLFGARGGLVILDPEGEIETLRTGESLPGSLVFGTHVDGEGDVWICTNGGLARYAEGRVSVLRESDAGFELSGLGDERVYVFDTAGHLLERRGPASCVLRYRYDARQRLAAVEGPWGELRLVRDGRGRLVRIAGFAEDVTDARRVAELKRLKEEADDASRTKTEFLSRMSHELRTPLNAVLGFAQLLLHEGQTPLTEEQRESVGEILGAGRHLLEIVDEMLDLTRIELGKLRMEPEAVGLTRIVAECVSMVQSQGQARNITIRRQHEVPEGDDVVFADRTRVRQILLNLLSNAIKYNVVGGAVSVTLARAGDAHLRVSVADTGAGLTADQIEGLFVPFQRLGSGRLDTEGTGLGLAFSKQLAEAMGGVIGAVSEPGQGATFWLDLPRA